MRQVVHNRQTEAGAWHLFVRTLAPIEHSFAGIAGNARAVVVDDDPQAWPSSIENDTATRSPRPFAGVVEQVAEHLLQILFFTAKVDRLTGADDLQLEFAVGMNSPHDANQAVEYRPDLACARRERGPKPPRATGSGDSRFLFARHFDLRRNQLRDFVRPSVRRIGHHAQRRLQRMREIAGLRSRPLDDGGILRQHGIEFFDQRLHFGGKLPSSRSWRPSRTAASAPRRR